MKKFNPLEFKLWIIISLLAALPSYAQAPVWASGFPSAGLSFSEPVTNGVYQSNLRVRVKANESGTAYLVTYSAKPAVAPTHAEIVEYVRGTRTVPSTMVGRDSIPMALANTEYSKEVKNIAQNASGYATYTVMTDGSGTFGTVSSATTRLKVKAKKSNYYYLEYLPADYASNTNTYPLLVFLHGLGEVGGSIGTLDDVLLHGPPKEITAGRDFPFIMISPQTPVKTWDVVNLNTFLEGLKTAYPRIDLNRIYFTGLSLGGIGTWNYALRYPQKLAAIVPISGNGTTDLACNLQSMPIWAFHDDPDNVVSTGGTTGMESRINNCAGYTSKMRVTLFKHYESDGVTPLPRHGIWTTAYSSNPSPSSTTTRVVVERPDPVPAGTTIYTWLLQHTLAPGANVPPTANAGPDVTIVLPTNNVTLTGSGTDSDGSVATYAWRKTAGPAQFTIQSPGSATTAITNLVEGQYTFRLTVTDNVGYKAINDVIVTVKPAPSTQVQVWHSYDVAMQSDPAQQGVVSSNGSTPATMEFYQSVNDLGVDKGSLFSQYNPGNHPNAATAATTYWANGTGAVYPYAGKSTVGRGSEPGEGNVPPPTGVIDLQLHPPNSGKLIVAAFVVPVSGTYSVSNLAARRTATGGNGVDYQVFNKNKTLVVTLKAGTNQDWVQDTVTSRSLGSLAAGDRIYFSVYRQISDFSDHTEVAWTITLTGASARTAYAAGEEPATRTGQAVRVAPNPGRDLIQLSGVGKRGTVRVYDALGRLQVSKPFTSPGGRVELSAGALPPGLYYLSVQSDGQLSRHKWLKQ